ncbi:hypothetical protein MML48_6g00007238 [Holotrichia oblita]|uniref:Uncharacterized protein n=1 Tax=Holotrichia oblita TaxID=644536 RepID=A0ACB9SYK5_HOLOL|nr:hypothetical protein MML48_6g00007238 [Holotrichia oblita]
MSTRSGNRSKQKRSVQTTLGKAAQNSDPDPEIIDLSHLRKPIDTSLFGLSQILSLFKQLLMRYIAYECELMFECRICRTVFRSLANFILHKRNYCLEVYSPVNRQTKNDFENDDCSVVNTDKDVPNCDEKEVSNNETTPKRYPKRNLSLVLKKLADKEECKKYTESVVNEELTEGSYLDESKQREMLPDTIYLEGIESNKDSVFQTIGDKRSRDDLIKSEVMEIHHILNSNEAILAPDGKVFTFKSDINDTAGQKLICTICNLKFSTKKTLTHHIKYKHNDTRLVYICPECKDDFANAWCVFRHLYKVHRKTSTQIRRMRDHIHLNRIVKKQEPIKKKSNVTLEVEYEHEYDFPHDNSQYCEACGKRFDRKAALHSHIQMCVKRLALATIKENQKNVQEEKVVKQVVKGSVENEADYRKHLIQEIILGSRGTSTADTCLNKKFIGLVSDEEEILGFVKGTDILLTDKEANNIVVKEKTPPLIEENHQNNDCIIQLECTETISDVINVDVKIEETKIKPIKEANIENSELDLNVVKGEDVDFKTNKQNIGEGAFHEFPKIIAPKQYASKKCKSANTSSADQSTIAVLNEDFKIENLSNSNLNTLNNNGSTETIDLPFSTQNDDVTVDIEYNVSETNEVIYTSDSESCSCFDEKSNDSITSSEANEFVPIESTVSADVSSHKSESNTCAILMKADTDAPSIKVETSINEPLSNVEATISEFSNHIKADINEHSVNIDTSINETSTNIEFEINETSRNTGAYRNEASTKIQNNTMLQPNIQTNTEKRLTNIQSYADELISSIESDADEPLTNTEEYASESNEELSREDEKRGIKRKYSIEIEKEDESEIALRKRCGNCVDWSSFSCISCSIKFPNNNELLEHMALHFNWFRYECMQCNFKAYLKSDCINHRCSDEFITNCITEIPLWKTVNMASSFNNIQNKSNRSPEIKNSKHVLNKKEPSLTCNVENQNSRSFLT